MLQTKLLSYCCDYNLSDIHICSNKPVAVRVNGDIEIIDNDVIAKEEIISFLEKKLTPEFLEKFMTYHNLDFALKIENLRFRVNIIQAMGEIALVFRLINSEVMSLAELNLPDVIEKAIYFKSGLVLITGETGSGKSTTLTTIIDLINSSRKAHILTIEDPIEYVHKNKNCIVNQREIGKDCPSFAIALRGALRQDPDIILLGEMRDYETISLALTAAETGHLVFATLHTNGAASTINRIIDVFPKEQQEQAKIQLSQSLQMTITQQLHKTIDNKSRVPSIELMLCTPAIRNLIRENKTQQIESVLQTGGEYGMITMAKSIESLINKGKINWQI